MIGWLPLLGVLASAGGLQVDTGTPDALCPDLGQVREAAQARLGDIEAEGVWRASYALIHRPDRREDGDIVRLELRDPTGRLRLQRDLPRAGESCSSLAQALVVVLDSYFRHPTQEPTVTTPATRAPASPAGTATAGTLAAARERSARPHDRLALDLNGGWSGGWSGGDQSSPLLALALRVALAPPAWWTGVEAAWLIVPASQTLDGATATQRSFVARAFVARDLARDLRDGEGRTALLVGPEAVLALDRADGAMLMEGAARTRASFGGGLRVQLQIALAAQLRLGLLATVDYLPSAWGGSFWVQRDAGTPTEIFPASRVRLTIGAGVSWAVF